MMKTFLNREKDRRSWGTSREHRMLRERIAAEAAAELAEIIGIRALYRWDEDTRTLELMLQDEDKHPAATIRRREDGTLEGRLRWHSRELNLLDIIGQTIRRKVESSTKPACTPSRNCPAESNSGMTGNGGTNAAAASSGRRSRGP